MYGMIGLAITVLLALLTYKMALSKKTTPAMIIQIVLLVVLVALTAFIFAIA